MVALTIDNITEEILKVQAGYFDNSSHLFADLRDTVECGIVK